MKRIRALPLVLVCAAACSAGGSGGGASAPSTAGTAVAAAASGTAAHPAPATPGLAGLSGFAGTWDVRGTDRARGAFHGTATVSATASGGYAIQKLVTFATRLPTGRELVWAWNATGRDEASGLRVDASLRRAHAFRRAGTLTRTAADQAPLALSALLTVQGATLAGTFAAGGAAGPTETWTPSSAAPPAFPATVVRVVPGHAAPSAKARAVLFTTFASYHALPKIQPYVARPEFQAAIHEVIADTSGLDWLQKRGPTSVLVLDKVVDEIGVAEETRRANAFSYRLFEKAKLFDDEMTAVCTDANGMVTAVDRSVTPARRSFAQSPVLYTGVWTLCQYFRYQATREQEALDNVARGATGAVLCVEVPPVKSEFARAVDFLANASPGQVGPGGKYSWEAGTGAHASLMWMRGGNNDMLHGIEVALAAATAVLPASHPLRPRVGAAAASLLDNVGEAQDGIHEIVLSWVAATITGDPRFQKRYQDALGTKNLKHLAYVGAGGNLIQEQGIADWSGHHLGMMTLFGLRIIGGSNPSGAEQTWRTAGENSARAGFAMTGAYRNGLLASFGAAVHAPGANDTLRGVLAELPFPKTTGDCEIDFTVAREFCLSPYPSLPWKLDWVKNVDARTQSLRSQPLFYRGGDQNYWSRSPLAFGNGPDSTLQPGQDYLLVYWFARSTGAIGPLD